MSVCPKVPLQLDLAQEMAAHEENVADVELGARWSPYFHETKAKLRWSQSYMCLAHLALVLWGLQQDERETEGKLQTLRKRETDQRRNGLL
ncbi:hypothetical protein Y1Q_0000439 [Alligator mississippiensis]|uniref:Uncharacterized protein n=1 Tax=Alligator mississippiensis TaxID=8496 RepID=A0A151MB69_ALLMI|nr:hypothetical protein Y1Q_0000439 [Alligator mississippiensis]